MVAAAQTIRTPGYDEHVASEVADRLQAEYPGFRKYLDPLLEYTGALVLPHRPVEEFQPYRGIVMKASGGIAESTDELELFADTVADLSKLGLPVTIIHGAGKQIDRQLGQRGQTTDQNPDGTRITRAEHMPAVEAGLDTVSGMFEQALLQRGVGVTALRGLFTAALRDETDLGSVETITHVDAESIKQATCAGNIALVSCIGEQLLSNGDLRTVNVNADIAWNAAVSALEPYKAVSLTTPQGILIDDTLVSELHASEALNWIATGEISGGAVVKAIEALKLVDAGRLHDVVITNVENLARELWTPKGAGTYIVR